MQTFLKERSAASAYDALAPYYDAFTAHHDYACWTARLLELAREHGLDGERCLDVGCGTGKSLVPLVEAGWLAAGCDASAEMLAHAAPLLRARATLHHLDARRLGVLGEFDLVWALDDVANYMLDRTDLVALLRGMAANLAPGGVLLFDANTLTTYRTFFSAQSRCEDASCLMVWRGLVGSEFGPGSLAEAELDVFVAGDDGGPRRTSHHCQRHHPPELVAACVAQAGLVLLGVYGQFPDARFEHPLDEGRHTKAIYLARLSDAP